MNSSNDVAEFRVKRRLFDRVSTAIACKECQQIPKSVPIYQDMKGNVICKECNKNEVENTTFRNNILEILLMELPIACKNNQNECKVVRDRQLIHLHEEECEKRIILCPINYCKEKITYDKVEDHVQTKHGENNGIYSDMKVITKGYITLNKQWQEKHSRKKGWRGTTFLLDDTSSNVFIIHKRFTTCRIIHISFIHVRNYFLRNLLGR